MGEIVEPNLASSERWAKIKAERAAATAQAPAPAITTPAISGAGGNFSAPAAGGSSVHITGGLDDGAKRELRALPLLDVYRRWFTVTSERHGMGDEVNVNCFNTDFHAGGDKNPQLGFNTAKNTYYCHACNVSGDIIDLAAVRFNLDGGSWKCPDANVHLAVKEAGEELLGMVFRNTPAGWQRVPVYTPMPMPVTTPVTAPVTPVNAPVTGGVTLGSFVPGGMAVNMAAVAPAPIAPATVPDDISPKIAPIEDDSPDEFTKKVSEIGLNWRDFVPTGSPLANYMEVVCQDDTPEEFHFWNYMALLGLVMGRKTVLGDSKNVHGNVLLCLIGRTGQGKSRSEGFISELMQLSMPFDINDVNTTGVRIVSNPGSGEFLAKMFIHEVEDPTTPAQKGKLKPPPLVNPSVKALIKYAEMSTMINKGAGKGSIIKDIVIDLYDTPSSIGGGSLTNGVYEAKNPFGTVMTTTQLAAIRNLVSVKDEDSGFLNRWWFVIGKNKEKQPWGTYIDISPLKQDVLQVMNWSEAKFRTSGGIHKLSTDAMKEATNFIKERCHPLETSHETAMTARASLTFKKLLLLFSANMMETEVSVNAVRQAKIAFEYLMKCMLHIGARVTQSDYENAVENVMAIIEKAGDEGVSPGDLRKQIKRRTKEATEVIDQHIQGMERSGMIEMRAFSTGIGRPSKRYFICGV